MRWFMSLLPYSAVKNIDFFLHRHHLPKLLWSPLCAELERRRARRAQKKWWDK